MFEYCRARHIDPSYEFYGSTDYAILDIESRAVLLYSTEYVGGQFVKVSLLQPMKFEEFIDINQVKGRTLRELFTKANKIKGGKVLTKCIRAEKEALMSLILKDLEAVPAEVTSDLEAVIAETF